jgi:hypothetical protein
MYVAETLLGEQHRMWDVVSAQMFSVPLTGLQYAEGLCLASSLLCLLFS